MKLCKITSVVIAILFLALSIPAQAGILSFDVIGTLGPVLAGNDPLGLSGLNFHLAGSIDQSAVPISVIGDSATYDVPGTLTIMVGKLPLTGFYPTITLTDPASGPDTLTVDFNVVEFTFTPIISASLSLPDGTLHGTGIQNFGANFSQPDSYFIYSVLGGSQQQSAIIGLTGTVTMGNGVPPSGVPEPGTMGLLAASLTALIARAVRSRGCWRASRWRGRHCR